MSLVIKNLHANVQGTEILKGINLEIPKGEVHAIMGPNGSGKSTLSKVLCGHPERGTHGVDSFRDNAEGIYVQAGIRFIQNRKPGL